MPKKPKNPDKTLEMNVDDLMRTVPVICSCCGKIYHLKQWKTAKGQETVVSHGICPECEAKQKEGAEGKNTDKRSPSPGRETAVFNVKDMLKTIPVACAWCGKIYQLKQWDIKEGRRTGVSHGACPTCAEKYRKELEQSQGDS